MMPAFLNMNTAIIALIVVLLVALGGMQLRVSNLKTRLAEERQAYAEARAEWSTSSEAAEREARRALTEATERAEREYWQRLAELEATAEDLRDEVAGAQHERDMWQRRFEAARRESPACEEWAEGKVRCTVE